MKKITRHIFSAILAFLLPTVAVAQSSDSPIGFLGHPLIKQTGYKAEAGSFLLTVLGQGIPEDLTAVTDDDPDNATEGFNLLGVTVGYDEIIRVVPDPTASVVPNPLENGKDVGFLISPAGSNLDLLDLTLIHMFTINFLDKEGELIESKVCQADEDLNILDLSLVSLTGEIIQKVTATIPEHPTYTIGEKRGQEGTVYGISLSVAGVDVSLAREIKVHYAFIDDYEIVPIIKRYYPNSTGERYIWPWTKTAPGLVNNDLEDGPVITVANAYSTFTVYSGETTPFPRGAEAGWVITEGTVLSIDISQIITFQGITTTGEVVDISTQFSLAKINLIGGGTYHYTFMTPKNVDLIGFQLKVAGLTIDAGAKVVNYAYIKLPNTPDTNLTPYKVNMEAAPGSTVSSVTDEDKDNPYVTNKNKNTLYFQNDEDNPLYIPTKTPEDKRQAIWLNRDGWYQGYSHNNPTLEMAVTRRDIYIDGESDEVTLGVIDIVMTTANLIAGESGITGIKQNKVYYRKRFDGSRFSKNSTVGSGGREIIDFDAETGIINFAGMSVDEDENPYNIYHKGASTNKANVVGYQYRLYYVQPNEDADNMDSRRLMSVAETFVPTITTQWELAGTVDYIRHDESVVKPVDSEEINTTQLEGGPSESIEVNTYNHYITIEIPDELDDKTTVKQIDLYSYYITTQKATSIFGRDKDVLTRELINSYTRNPENPTEWVDNKNVMLDQYHSQGRTKIIAKIEQKDSKKWYGVNTTVELTDNFRHELINTYKVSENNLNSRNMTYAWYWDDEPEYTLPSLSYTKPYSIQNGDEKQIISRWEVNLEESDAKISHINQLNSASQYADDQRNVEITYNCWSVLKKTETGNETVTQHHVILNKECADDDLTNSVTFKADYGDNPSTNDINVTIAYSNETFNDETTYSGITRAYIPVVPSGFENLGLKEVNQTYLVIEEKSPEYLISTLAEGTSGIKDVVASGESSADNGPFEYFNIQGIRIQNPSQGIYLRRASDGSVSKVYVK